MVATMTEVKVEEDKEVVDVIITMTMEVADMPTTFFLPSSTHSHLNREPYCTTHVIITGLKRPIGYQQTISPPFLK